MLIYKSQTSLHTVRSTTVSGILKLCDTALINMYYKQNNLFPTILFNFVCNFLLLKIVDLKTSVQSAMEFGIILFAFQNLQEVNYIFKMAASTGLLEARISIFEWH